MALGKKKKIEDLFLYDLGEFYVPAGRVVRKVEVVRNPDGSHTLQVFAPLVEPELPKVVATLDVP